MPKPRTVGDAKILYIDVVSRRAKLLEAVRLSEYHYFTTTGSVVVFVPRGATPLTWDEDGKPLFIAVGGKVAAIAQNPELLARVGLSTLAAGDVSGSLATVLEATVKRLIDKARSGGGAIEVELEPSLKLAVALPLNDAVKAITEYMLSTVVPVHAIIEERLSKLADIERKIMAEVRRMEQVKIAARYGKWLVLAIVAMIIIAAAMVVLNMLPMLLKGYGAAAAGTAAKKAATEGIVGKIVSAAVNASGGGG